MTIMFETQFETQMDVETVAILAALSRIEGVGNRTLWQLLQAAGSPRALWDAPEAFLKSQLPKGKYQAFARQRDAGYAPDWLALYDRLGITVLPYTHAAYPPALLEIYSPPVMLYVQGEPQALTHARMLAVVGTRRASEYGRQVTDRLIADLAPAVPCVVSGLAAGIDTAAHWAALQHDLPTVAVFGCGLDVIFPRTNRRLSEEIVAAGGALVSEYPLGTPGSKYTYPERNRIVAGLSQGVLVVEGSIRSGALITARLALEEGRMVYAVPGHIFAPNSAGPHYLIRNGAMPVSAAADLLEDLHWQDSNPAMTAAPVSTLADPKEETPLGEADQQILRTISYDPMPIDAVQRALGWPAAVLGERLTMLELDGLIVLLPGAQVCRK